MHPRDFYRLGELLASGGAHPEASQRTSISRSYYAAMLEARDLLTTRRNWKVSRHQTHQVVTRAFQFAKSPDLRLIGRQLLELKRLREEADYQVSEPVGNVKEALSFSDQVHKALTKADVTQCYDSEGGK